MTLKVYDCEQGSDEWLQARCGIPTSTTISAMLTPAGAVANNQASRTAVHTLAAERLTGRPPEPVWSRDIERGHLDEPIARKVYEQHTGEPVEEVGFMVANYVAAGLTTHKLGFSPDGLVGEYGLTEFKSRKPNLHLQYVLTRKIPFAHMVQMQTGMLVSDRTWCDYVSYSGGLPMHIQRVHADGLMQYQIIEAATELERRTELVITKFEAETKRMPETEYVDHFAEIEIEF